MKHTLSWEYQESEQVMADKEDEGIKKHIIWTVPNILTGLCGVIVNLI